MKPDERSRAAEPSRNPIGIPLVMLGAFVAWFCGVQIVGGEWPPIWKWGLASGIVLMMLGGVITFRRR